MAAANKNRTQRSIDGRSHVDCIDLAVRKGTLVPGAEEMATSWQRCLTAHHLDPEIQGAPHIITEKEIKDSREPLRKLIFHAQEELDRLYAIVGPQKYVVLLCNRDGIVIHHRGDESMADAYKDRGIWLGAVLPEQIEGTNGRDQRRHSKKVQCLDGREKPERFTHMGRNRGLFQPLENLWNLCRHYGLPSSDRPSGSQILPTDM